MSTSIRVQMPDVIVPPPPPPPMLPPEDPERDDPDEPDYKPPLVPPSPVLNHSCNRRALPHTEIGSEYVLTSNSAWARTPNLPLDDCEHLHMASDDRPASMRDEGQPEKKAPP